VDEYCKKETTVAFKYTGRSIVVCEQYYIGRCLEKYTTDLDKLKGAVTV